MRYFPMLCWFGLSFAVVCCDQGSSDSNSSCGPGLEQCGSKCVSKGACVYASGGSTGSGGSVNTEPASSSDCTDTATQTGKLSIQYASYTLNASNNKQYVLSTNWWHVFDGQTVDYQGLGFTIHNPNSAETPDDSPIGFPTLYIGSYQGRDTKGSNLPKQVSELTSIPTVLSTNAADGARDEYNATYDVWFTKSSSPLANGENNPLPGGAYLMVWLFKPSDRQPRGRLTASSHAVSGVDGNWNVWVDTTDPLCVSYVATTPRDNLAFDLNNFIQDSVTNKYGVTSSMYLSIIFAGFEIWSGGEGLQVKNFCAQVN